MCFESVSCFRSLCHVLGVCVMCYGSMACFRSLCYVILINKNNALYYTLQAKHYKPAPWCLGLTMFNDCGWRWSCEASHCKIRVSLQLAVLMSVPDATS